MNKFVVLEIIRFIIFIVVNNKLNVVIVNNIFVIVDWKVGGKLEKVLVILDIIWIVFFIKGNKLFFIIIVI